MTEIVIPDSVMDIGSYAFQCTGLTSVVIGKGVTNIGENAFRLCTELENVYYKGTAEDWSAIVDSSNTPINATRYYYSETEPALNSDGTAYDGNFWHYVDGVPTKW